MLFFQRSSLGESKVETKATASTDSSTEPIYANSTSSEANNVKRTNSINIGTQTQQDEKKSSQEPALDLD